jgi:hypothetical protein
VTVTGSSDAEMVNVLIDPMFVMVDIIVMMAVTKITVLREVSF